MPCAAGMQVLVETMWQLLKGQMGQSVRGPSVVYAVMHPENCLIPSKGTKCDTNTGFGPGPVEAFCCDAMDLPGCEASDNPRMCPVSDAAPCVSNLAILMPVYLFKCLSYKQYTPMPAKGLQ